MRKSEVWPERGVCSGMDWDDLRVLHAFAEAGTLAQAARRLGVDPSTISRRLQELERALGAQLLVRTTRGMELTDDGTRAAECARIMFGAVDALERAVSGADARREGSVRISCAEAFSPVIVTPLASLRAQHPNLSIEMVHGNEAVDLRKRDADVAIRMFRDVRDGLVMRKLGSVGWSVFAAPDYLAKRGYPSQLQDLSEHDIVGYAASSARSPGARWLAERVEASSVVFRAESTRSVLESVRHAVGLSVLPCWLATDTDLVRLTDAVVAQTDVFAVYPPEFKTVARIQLVVEHLAVWFKAHDAWLAGELER